MIRLEEKTIRDTSGAARDATSPAPAQTTASAPAGAMASARAPSPSPVRAPDTTHEKPEWLRRTQTKKRKQAYVLAVMRDRGDLNALGNSRLAQR